jgi:uncharacterized repeat protein (TIGR01451 family)
MTIHISSRDAAAGGTSPRFSHFSGGRFLIAAFCVAFYFCFAPAQLLARDQKELDISLRAQRVLADDKGAEKLMDDTSAQPGEVVQYTATLHNKTTRQLLNVTPAIPVPVGMEYLPDTDCPTPALASIDGKTFERFPIRRTRTLIDGRTVSIEVPAKAYRALKWFPDDMPAGSTRVVAMRVRVIASNATN